MRTAELLLVNFDREMRGTRTTLERVPEDKADFKPHEKSMALGRLAAHVSTLPKFLTTILKAPSLDIAAIKWPPLVLESREKLLADFDSCAAEARKALLEATDEQLDLPWRMSWGEKVITEEPRSVLCYSLFLNHLVHHRAQLGIYLRLNGLPVPALYGPSADDTLGF